ncbi:M949_RS01915 family surface polysaccharide biosynthesis protein [Pedobacter cryoconitis]|uniref:Lipoprotein n=1 Tax=Pedobacter cryoconitis TaxID=188932 RepID=A0A327T7A2_9SPHI|nr:hypothetical protein [Pedobacter cryoconitis]RAJ37209.1 hypothetical protein LY11_00285 [Pedobacter cryoconitis]
MKRPLSSILSTGFCTSIILVFAVLLSACSHSGTAENKHTIDSTTIAKGETGSVEIKSDTVKAAVLPAGITYHGKPVKIMSWKDKLGDNLLVLTETGEFASADLAEYEDNRDSELHVYHYVKTDTVWKIIAAVNDQISSCPVDIVTRFIPGALFITDLNGDGVAECTFAYHLTCTGGVDNKVMKLIMLENKNKYVIRGTTSVNIGEEIPGTMKYEAGIPERFKVFMIEKWKAFEREHYN